LSSWGCCCFFNSFSRAVPDLSLELEGSWAAGEESSIFLFFLELGSAEALIGNDFLFEVVVCLEAEEGALRWDEEYGCLEGGCL
jgi:hypothetical protein